MDPFRAVGIDRSTPLFHGGAPGLEPGDILVPERDLLGAGTAFYGQRRGIAPASSVVYLSKDREVARAFATRTDAFLGKGCLYKVRPQPASSLAVDADFPKVGVTCKRGEIIEVLERDISMHFTDVVKAFAPHLEWEDGSAVYDADGYMTPAPNHVGADEQELRSLGTWLPVDAVGFDPIRRRYIVVEAALR